jgi:hypothetical protein
MVVGEDLLKGSGLLDLDPSIGRAELFSFSVPTALTTSRCARLNTRRPKDATVHTPPVISESQVILTNYPCQADQEMIKAGRPFPYSESHGFQIVL